MACVYEFLCPKTRLWTWVELVPGKVVFHVERLADVELRREDENLPQLGDFNVDTKGLIALQERWIKDFQLIHAGKKWPSWQALKDDLWRAGARNFTAVTNPLRDT